MAALLVKKKKILALLLSVSLLTCLSLSGCGESGDRVDGTLSSVGADSAGTEEGAPDVEAIAEQVPPEEMLVEGASDGAASWADTYLDENEDSTLHHVDRDAILSRASGSEGSAAVSSDGETSGNSASSSDTRGGSSASANEGDTSASSSGSRTNTLSSPTDTQDNAGGTSSSEGFVVPDNAPSDAAIVPGGPSEQTGRAAWTTTNVNFRAEPSEEGEIFVELPPNTEVYEVSVEGDWASVIYDEREGYIFRQYLTSGASEPEQPPAAPVTPVSGDGSGRVVFIDPGHQTYGDSSEEPNGPGSSEMKARVTDGTTGEYTGVTECELNLVVSLKLRDELQSRGYTVYMSRETNDVNISNMERAQLATEVGADITVRIHANSSDSSDTNGALVLVPSSENPYVSYLASESQRLGGDILNYYCSATGMANDGVQTSDTMTGINWCTMPVTILEMGFMSNYEDDTNMQDSGYQANMVQGIANGIDAYFAGE